MEIENAEKRRRRVDVKIEKAALAELRYCVMNKYQQYCRQ